MNLVPSSIGVFNEPRNRSGSVAEALGVDTISWRAVEYLDLDKTGASYIGTR